MMNVCSKYFIPTLPLLLLSFYLGRSHDSNYRLMLTFDLLLVTPNELKFPFKLSLHRLIDLNLFSLFGGNKFRHPIALEEEFQNYILINYINCESETFKTLLNFCL